MDDLKSLRIKAGYNQTQVATTLKISIASYNHYETGKRRPGLNLLKPLSELYNCTIEELITAVNETYKTSSA
ncbi:MAG: helix-turn-helix transcriptional regulator [Oscillospiraceae bacterium]|nr:helix-turn-helix transcriptional regulator [Oscillospiraceae bacterium]